MGKKKAKVNIPMCAAAVLLCLTLVSIHLTSGLYARYSTSASGSDSARVAKFDVAVSIESAEGGVTLSNENKSGSYTIVVENNSEVAIEYSLALSFTDRPDGLGAKLGESDGLADDKAISFGNKFTLAPGASSAGHILTLTMVAGQWGDITKTMSGISDTIEAMPFTVEITAVQID